MNKKLIAMAVGSALGALGATTAFAQASTVTLSGSLNFNYGYFDNGTGKVRTDALSNQESEWVLSGEERVGGNTSVFFKCSSSLDVTGGTASNMCARNSGIGLKGSYGAVAWGNNDTPAKRLIAGFDPFPISAAMGQGAQMWNATASNTGNGLGQTQASFSRRQQNLIQYDMPTMGGFNAMFAYSAANEATGATTASTIQKPRLWSAGLSYTNGPLLLGAAFERHVDYNPGGAIPAVAANATRLGVNAVLGGLYTGGNDDMWSLGVAYTFMGSLRLSGIYNHISYNNITVGTDMSVRTWGAYADWAISGPHRVRLGYGSQGSTKGSFTGAVGSWVGNAGAGNTGAQKIHAEYAYALSKRTELGLAYARVNNDALSTITVGTGSNTPNAGESQSFYGMLIRHKF